MSELFQMDNAFFRFMTKLVQLVVLNLLWLLCSIPLITIGASTTALYSVCLSLVGNEEGYIIKDFFKVFKRTFRKATGAWLLLVCAAVILCSDIWYLLSSGNLAVNIIAAIFITMLVVVCLTGILIFPITALHHDTVKENLKNACITSIKYLYVSIALLILLFLICYGLYISVPIMILVFVIGIALYTYIASIVLKKVL